MRKSHSNVSNNSDLQHTRQDSTFIAKANVTKTKTDPKKVNKINQQNNLLDSTLLIDQKLTPKKVTQPNNNNNYNN